MIHLSIGESGVIVNYFRSKNTKALPELGCKSVDLIFKTPPTISHLMCPPLINKHALSGISVY